MITVYYSNLSKMHTEKEFGKHLGKMPVKMQEYIVKAKNPKDKLARFSTRLLLKKGLENFGFGDGCLEKIERDFNGRPYHISEEIDFNASCSGDYVVCGFSTTQKLGVDVQQITSSSLSQLNTFFTEEERTAIEIADDPNRELHRYWALKESVLKCAGCGLIGNVLGVQWQNDQVYFNGQIFYSKELHLDQYYTCFLTSNKKITKIDIKRINFL